MGCAGVTLPNNTVRTRLYTTGGNGGVIWGYLPAVQRHNPPAVASHTPEVRGGPQGTENLRGLCENLNQFPPKRQHNLRVLNDAKYNSCAVF
jgi:hypothetical protein